MTEDCDERCYNAITPKETCRCRCGGKNHGIRHKKQLDLLEEGVDLITEQGQKIGNEFHFKDPNKAKSKCGIRILVKDNNAVVVLTELPDNPGMSITNCYGHIATIIKKQYLKEFDHKQIMWLEHYLDREEYYGKETKTLTIEDETFDQVLLKWANNRYIAPNWKPLNGYEKKLENFTEID